MPALSAGKKAKEKTEPGTRIASRLSLVVCATKKMPALSAGEKAKEKTEPGTRIASRLSLENDPNCDTNEPPLALGGSLRAKGVHHK